LEVAVLKIYISADLEGVNGVVSPEDINWRGSGYQQARQYMADEVNAALSGAFSGGATDVVVCDAHGDSRNLLLDCIDEGVGRKAHLYPYNVIHAQSISQDILWEGSEETPRMDDLRKAGGNFDGRVTLLTGEPRKYSMVHGLDSDFSGLICLGYHAKFGTMNAVLDHSYLPAIIRDIRINGTSHGELGVNALFAAAYGVPLIMASGDQALAAEAKLFDPATETVVVKHAEGRFSARCLPINESLKMLRETAMKAVRSASKKRPVATPDAPELEIVFQQVNLADGAMRVWGTVRKDAFTVSIKCADMIELMTTRQTVCQAAAGFYNTAF
jgi:D-amino peptidase